MTDGGNRLRDVLHRQLWQRLPRSWRRAGLFRATASLAPLPTPWARPTTPIIVAGALRTASGLGESARLCHDALKVSGKEVFGIDLTAGLMQPMDRADFAFADARTQEGPGTLIVHVNSPLMPLAIWLLGRKVVRDKYIVGYWAWELPEVFSDWRHGVPFVHEIWVPSAFTADAVRSVARGRTVRVIPHPVALRGLASVPGASRSSRPFTVLLIFNMASSFARKNPLATISAFRAAFSDHPSTRLIIKTSNADVFPDGMTSMQRAIGTARNIVLVDKTMSAGEIDALYHGSDLVMSLHRSEGFGLTIAEAMLRGLPVMATNWSGNVDYLSGERGVPIPYRHVAAEDPQGTYHCPRMMWADADVEAAASALRSLREDPELGRQLGANARAYAARVWSAEGYAERVRWCLGL